jgi:hypothetical protein
MICWQYVSTCRALTTYLLHTYELKYCILNSLSIDSKYHVLWIHSKHYADSTTFQVIAMLEETWFANHSHHTQNEWRFPHHKHLLSSWYTLTGGSRAHPIYIKPFTHTTRSKIYCLNSSIEIKPPRLVFITYDAIVVTRQNGVTISRPRSYIVKLPHIRASLFELAWLSPV